MPYIQQEKRATSAFFRAVDVFSPVSAGELNYLVTMICKHYLDTHGLSYQTCNDIVGALDNAKDEFRRRVQHPYEDKKIKENGDVY